MIKIWSTSVPYNQPLTNQEAEAAVAVIGFTNELTSVLKVSDLGLALRIYR